MRTHEPGTWEGRDDTALLQTLDGLGIPVGDLLDALERDGLLVRKAYYVPSVGELYDMYGAISRELWRGMQGHVRWVMCRETHDALARRHVGQRAALPAPIATVWREQSGYIEPETVAVADVDYRDMTARLFGVPVRIDPAARSPLFEIDQEATVRRRPPQ